MKYIRTKDGRIIDAETLPPLVAEAKYNGEGIGEYHGSPIVAEADTIEELCDVFIVSRLLFSNKGGVRDYDSFKGAKECALRHNEPLYGAIWTKGGLIYVAKMNEKGELELL